MHVLFRPSGGAPSQRREPQPRTTVLAVPRRGPAPYRCGGVPTRCSDPCRRTPDPAVACTGVQRKRSAVPGRRVRRLVADPARRPRPGAGRTRKDGAPQRFSGRRRRGLTGYQAHHDSSLRAFPTLGSGPDDVPPAAYSGEWVPGSTRGAPPRGGHRFSSVMSLAGRGSLTTVIPASVPHGNRGGGLPPPGPIQTPPNESTGAWGSGYGFECFARHG